MRYSWLHPSLEARAADDKGVHGDAGWGVFVRAPIAAGTSVVAWGGQVVDGAEFFSQSFERRALSLQIDEDLWMLCPEDLDPADRINHSCEPNLGFFGNVVLKAMRDLEVGEEATMDYAMLGVDDTDDYECACGSTWCRIRLKLDDHLDPVLQERYRGWFSPHIQARIDRSR